MKPQLTPGIICRMMTRLVLAQFIPGTFERGQDEPNVIRGDLLQRHVQFEVGGLTSGMDEYAEYTLLPQATGLAALLRMANAWRVFDLPMPTGQTCCRAACEGLSIRLIELLPDETCRTAAFRFDVLFQPREIAPKSLINIHEPDRLWQTIVAAAAAAS